jgi:hypothetical protein
MTKIIFAAAVMLCACSPTESEVSRVAIPETALSVVVVQDEKRLYRYRFFEDSAPVTEDRIFGGSSTRTPVQPVLTETDGLVRISWSQEGFEVAFLVFDKATGQIAQDSNLTGRPPSIGRQEKSARFEAQQAAPADRGERRRSR